MPAPSVAVPHATFAKKCDRHSLVASKLMSISDPNLRRLLAELVMMRLFDDFQEALQGFAIRLACGATYVDGASPVLLTSPASTTAGALAMFENLNRTKPIYAKWSKYTYISGTVKHVLDQGDHFLTACRSHTGLISEMQAVRNRIAHAKAKSYPAVVQRHYGAAFNHITPGVLLLTDRFSPTLLDTYIASCRTIAKACSRS